MNAYEIRYTPTGKNNITRSVWLHEPDFIDYGIKDKGITGAVKTFEKIAADLWHTYETSYAITEIKQGEI